VTSIAAGVRVEGKPTLDSPLLDAALPPAAVSGRCWALPVLSPEQERLAAGDLFSDPEPRRRAV